MIFCCWVRWGRKVATILKLVNYTAFCVPLLEFRWWWAVAEPPTPRNENVILKYCRQTINSRASLISVWVIQVVPSWFWFFSLFSLGLWHYQAAQPSPSPSQADSAHTSTIECIGFLEYFTVFWLISVFKECRSFCRCSNLHFKWPLWFFLCLYCRWPVLFRTPYLLT